MHPNRREGLQCCFLLLWLFLFSLTKAEPWFPIYFWAPNEVTGYSARVDLYLLWPGDCVSASLVEKLLQTSNEGGEGPRKAIAMEGLFTGYRWKRQDASLCHRLSEQWQPANLLPVPYSPLVTACANSCPGRCLPCVKHMIHGFIWSTLCGKERCIFF